ncbi:MAG: hypothetical protein PHI34_06830 [Acidobacteriota bacterium]|nr:hypothetical protein [Acidobacteriota bacterium]
MKKTAIIALFLLYLTATGAFGLTWRTDSVAAALAQAKAEGKLLLIDFFTEYG